MRRTLVFVIVLLLAGCAHVVSKEMRDEALKDVDTSALFSEPERFAGATVVLGGVIINSTNEEDGGYIEILQRPLDRRGRPRDTDDSRGRFLVFQKDYIETEIYVRGRLITVAGEVVGVTERPLGEAIYTYPLIRVREMHLIKPRGAPRVHFGFGVFQSF